MSTLTAPQIKLTKAQSEAYRKDGYFVVESLFTKDDLRQVREVIEEITRKALAQGDHKQILELEPEPIDGQVYARRIYDPFERHQHFRDMATDPRVLDRIEGLIGPDIGIHHSKLNMKPPRVGSPVEWHQDLTYFPHTNSDLVTTLVYLDDASEENGCLKVLPGEHRRFFSHSNPDGTFAGMITEDFQSQSARQPVALSAPAGSVIFMHCILPHASLPNRSPQPRRTLIFEYRAADAYPIYCGPDTVKFETKTHLLRGKPAPCARCETNPAPVIPQLKTELKSLYEMQLAAKNRAAAHM